MSVRFKILKTVYKLSGIKRMFGLPQEKLFAKAAQLNAKRGFAVPTDKKHVYTDVRVGERGHCLKIRQPGTQRDRAMLFLFGGGMVIGPDAGDRKAACKLAFPCQLDVWMPWYPLCPKYNIKDAVDMVLETYRLMLREYKAENIVFCGFSSGASLAVCTCLHNLRQDKPMPNPACILASSPGGVPHCEEEKREMERLGRRDIMIDPAFMELMKTVLSGGRTIPEYLQYPCTADFTGMPPIHFWWGSDEVLYAEAPYYLESCKKAGVEYTVVVGEGMCHCYAMLDIFPEGKAAQEQMHSYMPR